MAGQLPPKILTLRPENQIASLYEDATRAAQISDWYLSAHLLKQCCRISEFQMSHLNSQWMVAADRAGTRIDLGSEALELAQYAWDRGNHSSAFEFLQLALWRPPRQAKLVSDAMRQAREWPTLIATKPDSKSGPSGQANRSRRALRIGHLVGCCNPTHAPTNLIKLLSVHSRKENTTTQIYSSEWASGWFHNWQHDRQSGPADFLDRIANDGLHLEPAVGTFFDRAGRLAQRIADDDLDILIVHASNVELVTALVSCHRPARCMINVNHASEMALPCFDGYVHLFANGLKRSQTTHAISAVIPPASNMADRLESAPPMQREDLGVPTRSTISGTFGNLYKLENPLYLASLRGILEAHPDHHHLIAGNGNPTLILDELGALAARVQMLGRREDIPSLLRHLDFYLASHPYPGALSEMEAMAAGCPVISIRGDADSHFNSGAEIVQLQECIVDKNDPKGIVSLAGRFLTDSAFARETGVRLRQRFLESFRPSEVAARHLHFYRSVLDSQLQSSGSAAELHSEPERN